MQLRAHNSQNLKFIFIEEVFTHSEQKMCLFSLFSRALFSLPLPEEMNPILSMEVSELPLPKDMESNKTKIMLSSTIFINLCFYTCNNIQVSAGL